MDNKRRSSAVNGANEADERAAKRQRLTEKYDLSKGETVESTTEHGLYFLEQIRRTQDKNGRKVAVYFEKLMPREGNAEYYKKTRMPISLSIIERKLKNGDFSTLTELESYFKRMVSNAKDYYSRSTPQFDDAERVRKALSNFMTKTNPAYARGGYTAVPTVLPAHRVDEAEDDDIEKPQGAAESPEEQEDAEEDDEEEGEEAEADEEDGEEDDDAEGEEDDDEGSQNSKPTILIRRRGPGRSSSSRAVTSRKSHARNATPSRPDYDYEGVPYKGLNFQAAQEKIVEEMIRKKEADEDEAYFEPFINLPPRALKDYYRVVKDPMSLRKLQKATKGVHGRNEATGISDLKSWAAFEEAASLLWDNAKYYNEEGSEIYELARELQEFFANEIKKAKAAVPEPSQPKIKLKVQQSATEQPSTSKKITIHVGGKSDSADSPAPTVPQAAGATVSDQAPLGNGTARQSGLPAASATMDRLRSTSVASPSPSVANNIKREDAARPSPAVTPGQPSTPSAFPPPAGQTANLSSATFQPIGVAQPQPQVNVIPQPPPKPLWDQQFRAPGKSAADALITNLTIQAHPMINIGSRFNMSLKPLERECKQSVTVHIPATQLRLQVIATLPLFLEKEGRQWRLWVQVNRSTVQQSHPIQGQVLPVNARVFDVQLQAGMVNEIDVSVAAALPKGQKLPNGADFEVETMTLLANESSNTTSQAVPSGDYSGTQNIHGNEADVQPIAQVRSENRQAHEGISALTLLPPITLQDVWDQAELKDATAASAANPLGFREYMTNEGLTTFYPPIPSWPEDDDVPTAHQPAAMAPVTTSETTPNYGHNDHPAASPQDGSHVFSRLQRLMSEEAEHQPLLSDSLQPRSSRAVQPLGHAASQAHVASTPTREAHTAETRHNNQPNAGFGQSSHATQQFPGAQAANGVYGHLPQQLRIVNSGLPGENMRLQLQQEQIAWENDRRAREHLQSQVHLQYQQSPDRSQQRSEMKVKQEGTQMPSQDAQNPSVNNQVGKVIKQGAQTLGDLESQHYRRKYVAVTREDYGYMGYYSITEMMAIRQRERTAGPQPKRPALEGDPDGEYVWSV
ncbi:bromodomain containing protein [Colletotrichum scovillei]|uniref:Bromodomain containing protein n=1 Tax=Colletotrichum scovillei TaxID=1209932 RepID=A0A9P7UB49_9PEZI|nr:bromodomain containing protein [Colletotrichum scovillei]KAG7049423.1 bromodomain containing protein [Colletotrichum scovillei]KAG7064162.1 bromodomain containing protein [Colletotrichum scovillei]